MSNYSSALQRKGQYGSRYLPTRSDVAPYRLTLKSNSSGTTTSVMYDFQTIFSAIRTFRPLSAIPCIVRLRFVIYLREKSYETVIF